MSDIKKILIPVDFTEVAVNALQYTGNFCKDDSSKVVTLLHVLEEATTAEQQQMLEAKLHDFYHQHSSLKEVRYEAAFAVGDLIESIVAFQKDNEQDLIIMGTKGSNMTDKEAETNTSKVVLEAGCPVIAVPENYKDFGLNHIALALGRSEIDDSFALGVLHRIAITFNAKVHILTINHPHDPATLGVDENESVLDYYLESIDFRHSFPTSIDIEQGITDYVKEKDIDMLAILPRNHAKKSTPSEGRLTKLLTLHAEVPVLSIV